MRAPRELPISWRRLWLQIGDPVLVTSPTEMRRELADIWAAAHAASQLGHGVDVVCAELELRVCELAVASLADPHSFDDGYWPSALERARAVVPGPVPQVEVPDIEPHDVSPVELMAEIMSRVAPRRSGVVVPVVDAIAKVERSRPGWRLSGLPEQVALPAASTHLGVFAIDEGDNEVLAIVPVGAVAAVVDLTEDNVITGLHERAWLMDRLAVAALVDVLRSLEAPAGEAEGFSRARAHAAVQAAVVSLDQQQLTVRATAVSAAVTYVASLVGDDLRLDRDWHLTRLVTLL